MNDTLELPFAALSGVLLGLFFFGGLWWTLRRALASRRPALWIGGSLLLRMAGAVAGFVVVCSGDWQRLLACLVGFWAARWFSVRMTAEPSRVSRISLSRKSGFAPSLDLPGEWPATAGRVAFMNLPVPLQKGKHQMQIQINTDNHIDGNAALSEHVETVVSNALRHIKGHITRVEVHLSDENGGKSGVDDKRCMLEARMKSHQPVAVSFHAGSIHQAVDGASRKLRASLEALLGRLDEHRHRPAAGEPGTS